MNKHHHEAVVAPLPAKVYYDGCGHSVRQSFTSELEVGSGRRAATPRLPPAGASNRSLDVAWICSWLHKTLKPVKK